MVASKTVGEYKRNQEKIRKFCLEGKTEQARQQEARAKQSRSAPLQTATVPQPKSVINTKPRGHAEVVAMARKNISAHRNALVQRSNNLRDRTMCKQNPQGQPKDPNG